ncbi:hypothetical protein Tco_0591194 [Tanacetum coccineum]
MLEKSMYDSWESRIRLLIKGKKHGKMMLDSIDNGPLVYPTVEENGQTRPKKYSELTEAQQLQDDCDVQATNIILHGLPPNVYALVNHQEAAKDIWDKVKMLMKGIELSYQELQVNTKFLNALPSEWSKFVTDVKLAKSLYTTNYDQLYAYLSQHERHANEVRITRERYPDPLAFIANSPTLYNPSQPPQHSASRFSPLNNQLRTSYNPRNQATIQDDRVTVQGRKIRVMLVQETEEFLLLQREMLQLVHQEEKKEKLKCTQPKRPRNAAWFKQKLMLVEAQEAGCARDAVFHEQTHVEIIFKIMRYIVEVISILYSSISTRDHKKAVIQDTNPSAPNDLLVISLVEQMSDRVAH